MSLRDCDRCGSFCVLDDHVCPPRYVVWSHEDGGTDEDGKTFRAQSASAAAEQWAEWIDRHSAEYSIVKGCDAVVHVRSEDGGETFAFTVTGEFVPLYSRTASSHARTDVTD